MAEELYQNYKDRGFILIYLLTEDFNYDPADQEDAQEWAETYGLTFPVLQDQGWIETQDYDTDNATPSFSLLGPGLEVVIIDGYPYPGIIEQYLPN